MNVTKNNLLLQLVCDRKFETRTRELAGVSESKIDKIVDEHSAACILETGRDLAAEKKSQATQGIEYQRVSKRNSVRKTFYDLAASSKSLNNTSQSQTRSR